MEVRRLEEENLFEVESEKRPGQYYVVDLQTNSCTCPHFKFRGVQCKHIKEAQTRTTEHVKPDLLTVETIPTILGEISRGIQESALPNKKHEDLTYSDSPPEFDYLSIY